MTKERLQTIFDNSQKIVFMTGAGISTPSGIPDFRSDKGLYSFSFKKNSPEQILSHSFFEKNPHAFYDFYKNKMIYKDAQPNIAHQFIASFEGNKEVTVVTQNIDGLHQAAGSKKVLELHGSIFHNHCVNCHKEFGLEKIIETVDVPICDKCSGIIKPDVVLYEEPLDMIVLDEAIEAISSADLLVVIGSSLTVNPAASLVSFFKGKTFMIINKTETPYDEYADIVIHKDVEEVINF